MSWGSRQHGHRLANRHQARCQLDRLGERRGQHRHVHGLVLTRVQSLEQIIGERANPDLDVCVGSDGFAQAIALDVIDQILKLRLQSARELVHRTGLLEDRHDRGPLCADLQALAQRDRSG